MFIQTRGERLFVRFSVTQTAAYGRSGFYSWVWRAIGSIIASVMLSMSLLASSAGCQRPSDTASTKYLLPDAAATRNSSARFSAWIIGTVTAPVSNSGTLRHDRGLFLAGFERQYALLRGDWGTLSTSPSLLPIVFTSGNRRTKQVQCGGPTTFSLCDVSVRYSTLGAGLMPLSLRLQTPASRRLSLALRADGGGIWFAQRIPAESGTRFNFTAEAGLDLAVRMAPTLWGVVGYRHAHLSNGGLRDVNVGIDANLLTLGLQWR